MFSIKKGLTYCVTETVKPDFFCFGELIYQIQDIAEHTLEPHAMYEKNTFHIIYYVYNCLFINECLN